MRNKYLFTPLLLAATLFASCSDDDEEVSMNDADYFVAIEAGTDPATDVLTPAYSIDENTISPEGKGFVQPVWMSFIQANEQIIVTGYTSAPEFVSYKRENGQLTQGSSFFTDLGTYAYDVVDDNTMIIVGSVREGMVDKKIYVANINTMTIEKTVTTNFGDDEDNQQFAFPVDVKVRGDKLFAAYFLTSADGSFATPMANEAKVAVFSYPELELEKIISDDRAPNIGRYYSWNALEQDENGDIYTFSPSSLASGYAPVPETNSGILRIKNGETEFDESFHIDFEALSGGYKINDMFYVANGKAVLRVLKEDENNADYLWATYTPNSETPLLETGILDLNTETFTILENVPKGGGGWNSATLIEGNKLYLGVSNSDYAGIYVIDVANGTAEEGAKIDGNYVKGILSVK